MNLSPSLLTSCSRHRKGPLQFCVAPTATRVLQTPPQQHAYIPARSWAARRHAPTWRRREDERARAARGGARTHCPRARQGKGSYWLTCPRKGRITFWRARVALRKPAIPSDRNRFLPATTTGTTTAGGGGGQTGVEGSHVDVGTHPSAGATSLGAVAVGAQAGQDWWGSPLTPFAPPQARARVSQSGARVQ